MSMQNIPDDDLDHFFRKASEERRVNYDEKAWLSLKSRLQSHYFLRVAFFVLLLVVSATLLVFFLLKSDSFEKNISKGEKSESLPLWSDEKKTLSLDSLYLQKSEIAAEDQLPPKFESGKEFNEPRKELKTKNQRVQENPPKTETSFTQYQEKKRKEKQENTGLEEKLKTQLETEELQPGKTGKERKEFYPRDGNQKNPADGFIREEDKNQNEKAYAYSISEPNVLQSRSLQAIEKDKETLQFTFVRAKKMVSDRFGGRFGLNFFIAPEWNTIQFHPLEKIRASFGIQLEYAFSSRLTVLSGLLYSPKAYLASLEDYKPLDLYWQSYNRPNYIDASCNVLDIPLNVRYYFKNRGFSKWYASAGFSSFLMLNERYNYVYDNLSWERKIENQNRHYFAILNLSAGHGWNISEKSTLFIEPYAKLPLGRVGYGRIHLKALGMQIGYKVIL